MGPESHRTVRGLLAILLFLPASVALHSPLALGAPAGQAGTLSGSAIAIGFGQTIAGSIDVSAETDGYSFAAATGDVVLIGISRVSGGLWPKIRLYDPDGTLLQIASSTVHAEISLALPAAGQYTILVGDGFDGTGTGDYSLSLQMLP